MARYLLIDIGAGTMDVLWYDDREEIHYKAVVVSPVRHLADKIRRIEGPLIVTGREMGGGEVSALLKKRAKTDSVQMTESAAMTIHHDRSRVEREGIVIVSEPDPAAAAPGRKAPGRIELTDLDAERIRRIVEGFGVPFSFDVLAVCAQDHGVPPTGTSHLDYRHSLFKAAFEKTAPIESLLYEADAVPMTLNRLSAIAESAGKFPAERRYVMDSGMAAVLGASLDPDALASTACIVVDVATSHTVAATICKNSFYGFFEYHTKDMDVDLMEKLLPDLASGRLRHQAVVASGGHGAYIRRPIDFDRIETIVLTGPKRRLLAGLRFPVRLGAPMGDNMMTGTVGLLEAVRRRSGMGSIPVF